ncbi:MAG: ATP-dependent helicase, partial [Candidatus Dormibacteria bacterium]
MEEADDALAMNEKRAARLVEAFAQGTGAGLVRLGAAEIGNFLPPAFTWWRGFASRYVTSLCLHSSATIGDASSSSVVPDVPAPTDGELASLVLTGPMMPGAEYLTADVLRALWTEIGRAIAASLSSAKTDLQSFLKGLNPTWNLVGRVHFNLAENRRDPESPFAFMATYTTQLSAHGKAQQQPLGQALREYAGAANRNKLLSLLLPVQRAAEKCT